MCGVIACISLSGELHPNFMKRLLTLLHHRGPDASGISPAGIACFGHTRLSILAGETKRILRKEKQGSTSDVQKWLRTDQMRNLCQDMVNDKNGFCQSYLDRKLTSQLVENHFSSKKTVDVLVWMFLTIEIWFRKFKSGVELPQLGM
jgi:asparagine synthetase B (glutamine-hydrolysing)